jgi:hypothetical protein
MGGNFLLDEAALCGEDFLLVEKPLGCGEDSFVSLPIQCANPPAVLYRLRSWARMSSFVVSCSKPSSWAILPAEDFNFRAE